MNIILKSILSILFLGYISLLFIDGYKFFVVTVFCLLTGCVVGALVEIWTTDFTKDPNDKK